jgi:predicted TPR repeat methyltransferase
MDYTEAQPDASQNASAPAGADDPAPESVDLTLEQLLPFAMGLHREGRLDGAQQCYEALLRHEPDNANALHFLGVLLYQRGRRQPALKLIQRALLIDDRVAAWHNNLGNVLLDDGQFEAAAGAYQRCIDLDASNTEVLGNLGVLYRQMGQPAQAVKVLLQAIERAPDNLDFRNHLSSLYIGLGRFEEGFSQFAEALALAPQSLRTRRLLTMSYGKAGRLQEGLQACRDWLLMEPDSPQALHFLAAYGGAAAPERASDAYVQAEFDSFAKSFEAKLTSLEYQAPQLVGDAVARILGLPDARHKILDAGCGTGLCAPYLRPYAQLLVGVDLSANMLERAREKAAYDALEHDELVACLQRSTACYDLVVSADTLCYFGRLDDAFAAVKQALRPDGHWVFTAESHTGAQAYQLQTHGRYSHARSYLLSALQQAGFAVQDIAPVVLRQEGGLPVQGWLVCACQCREGK